MARAADCFDEAIAILDEGLLVAY